MATPSILLLAVLAVVALLVSEARASRLEWLFKPLASFCFVLLALHAGASNSVYGGIMLAGLLLCLAGDVLLIAAADGRFLAGLASFLLGHLCYALAFLQLPINVATLLASLLPVSLLAVFSLRWLRPHLPPDMRWPVRAYILVICSMLILAGASWGSAAGAWILAGAWGFAVSDLSVARDRFVTPGMANRLWGIPLYYGSQMLLAWSVGLSR